MRDPGPSDALIKWLALGFALAGPGVLQASEGYVVSVRADQGGPRINPAMWGVFFEDINFGADGGLYAELVKNRSFEFPEGLMGWSKLSREGCTGSIAIRDDGPFSPANPHYLRLISDSDGGYGVSNEGFRGMGIRTEEVYDFCAQARRVGGRPKALHLELVSPDGRLLGSARVQGFGSGWRQHKVSFRAAGNDARAHLNVFLEGKGALDLDMISLFPRHTWKDRPGGLRADLARMLADLHPGFVRFPGGCIVEGRYLTNRYQWKTTIGAPEDRKLIVNRWNSEFKHRPAPDYFQSFGLGFFEFFQLCEDLGAEPLPILNCGMACQFNSGELAPAGELDSYVQDALDLIEFANGLTTSVWGGRRAALGHPKPFHLKLLGIGNEQWGDQYFERYAQFAKMLKQRYPEVQLISSAGPSPADDRFKAAWARLRELNADIIDEHCYDKPEWFFRNSGRYDAYERTGPKVFMGEYAAQSVRVGSPENRNTLECALGEAAFMIGMERNAEVVRMASYAPLFSHAEGWQWTPDLIWCDNLRVYGTPSYYVQQLFSRNRGDVVLPTVVTRPNGDIVTELDRVCASATREDKTGDLILKLVNPAGEAVSIELRCGGGATVSHNAHVTVLTGASLQDENSFDKPRRVAPVTVSIGAVTLPIQHELKPYSLTVIRVEGGAK